MKRKSKGLRIFASLAILCSLLSASLQPVYAQDGGTDGSTSAQTPSGGTPQPAKTSPWARLPEDLVERRAIQPEVDPEKVYLAASWNDAAIHFLDADMNDTGSFPTGTSYPNGLAADGYIIASADWDSQSVRIFDYEGNLLLEWFGSRLANVQGLELVDNELAFYQGGGFSQVHFFTVDGTYLRSIPAHDSDEGLAYDGTLLWELVDENIFGINPSSGALIKTIPNPGSACAYGGSGLTADGVGALIVGCTDGSWYRVSTADGIVLESGNNELDMYGLASSRLVWMEPVYLRSEAGLPWGQTTNEAIMDSVFGAGYWEDLRYESVDPFDLFSGYTNLVFMEGGDLTSDEMESFLTANQSLIEEWVGYGGCLVINAAPNEGDGMSYGFDGVTLTYTLDTWSDIALAVDPGHPIFNGPFVSITTTLTGTDFAHAAVSGGGVSNVIIGRDDLISLAEKDWGAGHVAFGGMTTTNFHYPQPEATNLRANLLYYLTTFGCQVNYPVVANHDGVLFYEDFENGFANWTATGLWNLESQSDTCGAMVDPFPSPFQAAYLGDDTACNYDTGMTITDTLTLNTPVVLPTEGPLLLNFHSYEQTENACTEYDFRYVQISDDNGSTWDTLGNLCTEGNWYRPIFDLSAYAGESVLLRFLFATGDPEVNDFFGWMLDDIRINYLDFYTGASYFTTRADTKFVTPNVMFDDYDPYGSYEDLFIESVDDSGLLGTLENNGDGSFLYDPNGAFDSLLPGEQALESFTYVLSDGVYTDTANVYILVLGVDDPPVAVADFYSTRNDRTLNVLAPGVLENDYDPDGEPISAFLGSDPDVGSLSLESDGAFEYIPEPDFVGEAVFSYVVNSGLQWSNFLTQRVSFAEPEFPIDTPVDGFVLNSLFGEPIPPMTFNFEIADTPSLSATFTSIGPGYTSFNTMPNIEGPTQGTLWVDFGVDVFSAEFGFVVACGGYVTEAVTVTAYADDMTPLGTFYYEGGNTGFNYSENLVQVDFGMFFRSLSIDFTDGCGAFVVDNMSYFRYGGPTEVIIHVTPSEFWRFLPMTSKQ